MIMHNIVKRQHDRGESDAYVDITSRDLYRDFGATGLDRRVREWLAAFPDVVSCLETWEAYVDITSRDLYPDVDSCRTKWNSGTYLDNISLDFYKDLGGTELDCRTSNWIFSQFGSCQEEPQISELTNLSKETGDEHSSERFDTRQAVA